MTNRPAFVVGRFPPPHDGQTIATARCAAFLDGAFDVTRFNVEPPGKLVTRTEPRPDPRRALHFYRRAKDLRRALSAAPDAPVVWHSISPTGLGHLRDTLTSAPAFGPDRPVLAVLHRATYERLFDSRLTRRSARLLADRITKWVVQSAALGDALEPHVPRDRTVVIPNTIDEGLLCAPDELAAKRERRGPDSPLNVLFLSNMIPQKGYTEALHAVGMLHRSGMPVDAHFVGGWPDERARERFAAAVGELGVGDVLTHHGRVTDTAEVKRLHLAADAFLLPTYHPTETQPIAILEALNAGTPVVATDRTAVHDIDGGSGAIALVPPRSAEAIARAVEDLARPTRWHAMSRAARSRFDEAFAPAAVRARWIDVVSRLPARGR